MFKTTGDSEARRNGKKDGKLGIPHEDDTNHSDYLGRLFQSAEDNIKEVVAKFYRFMMENEGNLKSADEELERIKGEFDKKKTLIDSCEEKVALKFGTYILIIAFLSMVEIPVNFMAFSLFESPILSGVLALGFSVAVIFGAHFLGAWLKEGRRGWDRAHVIKVGVLILGLLAALCAVAYLREKIFETDDELRNIMAPAAATLAFLVINILFLIVATIASKFAHYSNPDMKAHMEEFERISQDLQRATRSYNRISAEVVNEGKRLKTEAEQIIDRLERLEDVYEQANMRARYVGFLKRLFNAVVFKDRNLLKKETIKRPRIFDDYVTKNGSPIPQGFLDDIERLVKDHE